MGVRGGGERRSGGSRASALDACFEVFSKGSGPSEKGVEIAELDPKDKLYHTVAKYPGAKNVNAVAWYQDDQVWSV